MDLLQQTIHVQSADNRPQSQPGLGAYPNKGVKFVYLFSLHGGIVHGLRSDDSQACNGDIYERSTKRHVLGSLLEPIEEKGKQFNLNQISAALDADCI